MRGKLMLGVLALAVVGACGGDKGGTKDTTPAQPAGVVLAPQQRATVKIDVDCRRPDGIDIDVDNWVVVLQGGGELFFRYNDKGNATPAPVVTIDRPRKNGADWKFRPLPITLSRNAATSAGNATGSTNGVKSYYTINVTCGGKTVSIDPDIFVN